MPSWSRPTSGSSGDARPTTPTTRPRRSRSSCATRPGVGPAPARSDPPSSSSSPPCWRSTRCWFATHTVTLGTCTQSDLDLWLATGPRSRYDVRHFVEWTTHRKLTTSLHVPPVRTGPGNALDAETRWEIIAKLLHDPGIEPADRVAGSFVLIYAQPLSRVAMMTTNAVTTTDTDLTVRFGTHGVTVPPPLATHITTLIATGRTQHVGIGATTPSPWLFPGHLPGRPITPNRLGQRLGIFGIDARAARRAAQQQLAAQVPAVVLAEMLGVSIGTAVDWTHAAGGDWANYAAITATNPDPT